MITLITGVPGAGKSYYAVYEMYQLLKSSADDFLIVSNVEGTHIVEDSRFFYYEIPMHDPDFFKYDAFKDYLNVLRQERGLSESAKVYIFIDEAQRYFDRYLKCKDTIYFFDYHRHLGVDIFLITQHRDKISKQINTLVEYEVRAVPPKLSLLPGRFVYNKIMGKEVFGKKTIPISKDVFAMYKSFDKGQKCKRSYRILLMVLIPAVIAVFAFWHLMSNTFGSSDSQAVASPAPSVNQYLERIEKPVTVSIPAEPEQEETPVFRHELSTIQLQRYSDGRVYYKDELKGGRVYNVDLNAFEHALSIRYDYYILSYHDLELYCSVLIDDKLIQIYPHD